MQVTYISSRIDDLAQQAKNVLLISATLIGVFSAIPLIQYFTPFHIAIMGFTLHRLHQWYQLWQSDFDELDTPEQNRVLALMQKHHIKRCVTSTPVLAIGIAAACHIITTEIVLWCAAA